MDIDIVKRFIYGAKEAYKKAYNHSYNFPITIESAYRLATNIETLLKEQEAVKPRVSSVEQRCGNCNKVIEMDGWITCPWCGKPILWEGR